MRKSTWVAGVLLVTSLTPAGAAVLCQKKSGAVFVRSACKKKEMALDVSGLGLVVFGTNLAEDRYGCSVGRPRT